MKKLFLTVFVAIATILSVNAQTSFGTKAGVNFASFMGDKGHNDDVRTAFHVGIVSEIEISETFSFQSELMYSAQGASYKDFEEEGLLYDGTLKLDYLNVPLMAKYYVAEGFSLEVGPQVGFLLSAKDDWEGVSTSESGEEDIKDDIKSIDFGVNLGIGYKLEGGLNFGARYNLGLSDINDYETTDETKNGVIHISVGYFF